MKIFASIACVLYCFISVAQTGKVGIGTNNPQAQLHTTGSIRFDTLAGAGKRLLYADANGSLTAAMPKYKNEVITNIISQNCIAAASSIMVTGQPLAINSSAIKVKINVNKPGRLPELTVLLRAPNGQHLVLARGMGGSNYTNTIFWDGASQSITQADESYTGTFKPMGIQPGLQIGCTNATPGGLVGTFQSIGGGSIVPDGEWRLWIADMGSTNTGQLLNWSISFDGSEPGSDRLELPGTINIDGINTSTTGLANMIPAAYGVVYSNATTAVSASSNNSTLSHPSAGVYIINFTSGNLSGINVGSLPVVVSLYGSSPGFISHTGDNGRITVSTYNSSGIPTDRGFSFVLYKP